MNGLFTLQKKLQAHLLDSQNAIFDDIVDTEKVSSDVRLSIYSQAYRSRLQEALAANYPLLQVYLGSEQFEALANLYIDHYPSHFRSIRWFGDQLKIFLREQMPYHDFPYLSELANVEWTMTLVFDAANSDVARLEDLANIPPKNWVNMRLRAHPSAHLIQLSWNVVQIWQSLSQEESVDEPFQNEMPVSWVFWRNQLINHYCSLTQDEASALDAVLKGSTFGEICEILCQFVDENEVAMRAASLLKGWLSAGFIAEICY